MHACGRLTAPPRECYTLHRKLRLSPSHSTPSPLFPALSLLRAPLPSGMSRPHTKTHTHTHTHTPFWPSGNLAHASVTPPLTHSVGRSYRASNLKPRWAAREFSTRHGPCCTSGTWPWRRPRKRASEREREKGMISARPSYQGCVPNVFLTLSGDRFGIPKPSLRYDDDDLGSQNLRWTISLYLSLRPTSVKRDLLVSKETY